MDRIKEVRRVGVVGSNGFKQTRHRTNGFRGSPDEEMAVELLESVRLRDRVMKDRSRERDIEKERERFLRERANRRQRRHAANLNREDGGDDESSEESVSDDEDEEDFTATYHPLSQGTGVTQHHNSSIDNVFDNHNHLQRRKSFSPSASSSLKVFKPGHTWKPGDEMIGFSVPRKARSACAKRSKSNYSMAVDGYNKTDGEQICRQTSSSSVRHDLVSTSFPSPATAMSPSSSSVSMRKKLKLNNWQKRKPPKVSSKSVSSNPEELEIEIAEVLFGLKTQSQSSSLMKDDSREVKRSSSDAKSLASSPSSNSISAGRSAIASKRKRPKQVLENFSHGDRASPAFAKPEMDLALRCETTFSMAEKTPGSLCVTGGDSILRQTQLQKLKAQEFMKIDPEFKQTAEGLSSMGVKDSSVVRKKDSNLEVLTSTANGSAASLTIKSSLVVPEVNNRADEKSVMDLMGGLDFAKPDIDMALKCEFSSSLAEKTTGSAAENGRVNGGDSMIKLSSEELKKSIRHIRQEEVSSIRLKESSVVRNKNINLEVFALTATVSAASLTDPMVPPPNRRSLPERGTKMDLNLSSKDAELRCMVLNGQEEEKVVGDRLALSYRAEEKKYLKVGEGEIQKPVENKKINMDLQLDLEKSERDGTAGFTAGGKKLQQQIQLPLKMAKEVPLSGPSTSSLPLPMVIATWPGGFPPVGCMAPLQGVISMDGSTISPTPFQPFLQPRPKRCATHCYIARSINSMQQLMKTHPFWQATAGSASMFGSITENHNGIPITEVNAVRSVNNVQEKGQNLTGITSHNGEERGSQPTVLVDSSQIKQQILLQQPLPFVPPANLVTRPAFIFPLNQQRASACAHPGAAKSHSSAGPVSSSSSHPALANTVALAGGAITAVTFNYPNMATNETQYLAILQNNAYPFPVPPVGVPPSYRGIEGPAIPMLNGSFYSSQMVIPSQRQQQQPPASQPIHLLQGHQNAMLSSNSSVQKHLKGQQLRPQGSVVNGMTGNACSQNLSAQKSLSLQPHQNLHPSTRTWLLENEAGGADNPSSVAGGGGCLASVNIYGQHLAMPIHPQHFGVMTRPSALAPSSPLSAIVNQGEKKPHYYQQQGLKSGMESLPPRSFAMSFGPINNSAPDTGADVTSVNHNQTLFHGFPEVTKQTTQLVVATAAGRIAQKKNYQIPQEGKPGGGDSSSTDHGRRSSTEKGQVGVVQSILLSRPDLANIPTSFTANNIIESSTTSPNGSIGPTRNSQAMTNFGNVSGVNAHIQAPIQLQQVLQFQQQQQILAVNAQSKAPASSNGLMYSGHVNPSPSLATKFPNYGFQQNVTQGNSNRTQSPPWKNAMKTVTSASPGPSPLTSSTISTVISRQQQQPQPQMHMQISFGGNQKPATTLDGQVSSNAQNLVGSPSTSSISKGSSGSPRTISVPPNNRINQASSIPSQQPKHFPSILGNPHVGQTSGAGDKSHVQQLSQQQYPKNIQQAHLYFSNSFPQVHSPHSTSSTTSGQNGYAQQRHPDHHRQLPLQLPVVPAASSAVVLSTTPVTTSSTITSDPAKAIVVASCNA